MINKSKTLPEIFEQVVKLQSKEEKVSLLKQYDTKQMRWIVDFVYNADKEDLYVPNFKKSTRPPEICNMNIGTAITRINSAIKIRHINKNRYDQLMCIVLEEVSGPEAELIADVIKGKKIEGISKSVWREVYPKFFLDSENI